jgi:hypothetical protein
VRKTLSKLENDHKVIALTEYLLDTFY